MPHAPRFPSVSRVLTFLLLAGACPWFALYASAQTASPQPSQTSLPQDTSSNTQAQPAQPSLQQDKTGYTAAPKNAEEVSTHDTPATFKVRVNLVLVHVVVRDSKGQVVTNLKKDDFRLADNRKPQAITSFSMETPESHKIAATSARPNAEAPAATPEDSAAIAALPQRFVALVYDDANMQMQDSVAVRDATTRLFGALAPSDRVGMYTTSGQLTQDYTEDRALLNKALLGVIPRPSVGAPGSGIHDCPEVNLYEADLIENQHDSQALAIATEDAVQCAFQGDERMQSQAQTLAEGAAARVVATGEAQLSYTYRHLEEALRHLAAMPGQRVMVLVSPGFVVTRFAETSSDLIDRANRANVVINTIDARGLFAPDVFGDIADPPRDSPRTAGFKGTYRLAAQSQQGDVLAQFADGTGGTFFHNRNDLDQGLREAVAAPAASYLLGFSPQNLKIDGRYHTLNVTLADKQMKYSIQARHGYFAPRTIHDPAEAAKEEIQEALFSQDEIRDLPVDLQTQFFRMDQAQARLAVLTHVNLKGIRFRKADGRNWNDLTVATAIFDQNGNFVTGAEKIVEMRLRDQTVDRMAASGFTVKSSFDIKPGTYLVRLVVRDAEGAQMAARNGAVNIP